MTLRKKTTAIIGITLVGLLLILFAVSQGILLNSYAQLEAKDTSKNVERALGALSDDILSLVTMTRDWAAWDDTYNFIENGNEAYIEANPTDTTFAGLRVNVMLFINSSGQIAYGKAFDLEQEQEVPVQQSFLGHISPESIIVQHPNPESRASGIILLPEGPLLISSQPILTSQNEGPIRGALIMGRFLNPSEIARLAETTRLSLTIENLDEPQMTSDFEIARSSLSGNTPIFVKPLDKNSVAGYTLLNDVYGNPIMMLRVDLPREIYQQGQASQLYFIGSILGVGLVFGLVVLLLLGKSVLSPLSRLSAAVSNIGRTGALSVRVPVDGKDELSTLSSDINRMLESLERSHDDLRESEEKFKHLVEDMNDGYFVVQNFRIVFTNARSAEMFGHSAEAVTGKTVEELLPPKDVKILSEWYARRLRGEALPQQYETTLTRADGTTVTVEFGAKRMYYAGKPAVSVVMRDITKRRQMEEALRDSEAKYRDVVERANDAVAIVQDTIIKYINNRSLELLGYSPKQMIGTPMTEYIHPDEVQRLISRYEQRMAGEPVDAIYETALLHKDGSRVDIEINVGLITYAGRPAELIIVRDITERRKVQEALRKSEEHYSTLVGSLADAVFKVKGRLITWCNDRVEEIYGYKRDELIGKEAALLFPEGISRWKFAEDVAVAIKKQGYFRGTHRVKRRNGSLVDVEYTISQIQDTEPIELVAVARDVTERKRMEEELLRLSDAVRMSTDSIVITDLEGNIVDVNEATLKIQGMESKADLIGLRMSDAIAPEEQERALKDLAEVMDKGHVTGVEYHILTRDGINVLVETSASVMRGKNGEPTGIVAITRDITERKQMEEALKRSEQNYRVLFNSTLDGLVVLDAETMKIVLANETAARMAGLDSPQSIIGANPLSYLPPEEKERAYKLIEEEVFEKNLHNNHEYHALNKDGKDLWVSVVSTRTEYQGKKAALVSMRDITEHKRLEEERQRMEERLRLAGRLAAVGELAAGVAHELNNPITAIKGFAQFLTAREDLDEAIRKDLDTIYRESQRAAKITQNLLSFARRHEPEKHLISINEVIEKTLELRAHPMKVNNIELVVDFAPDLPKTLADFHQMQQVFVNVINNAEQAMIEAHGRGRLVVKTQRVSNMIQISFADNGPGISDENMKRIFDPFFTTKEVGKGTGLGLSICYGLVEAHGGRIYAKSKFGQGATFVVEMPIVSQNQLVAEAALLNPGSRGVKWNRPGEQY